MEDGVIDGMDFPIELGEVGTLDELPDGRREEGRNEEGNENGDITGNR